MVQGGVRLLPPRPRGVETRTQIERGVALEPVIERPPALLAHAGRPDPARRSSGQGRLAGGLARSKSTAASEQAHGRGLESVCASAVPCACQLTPACP